ncbi:hypothetical protein Pla22_40450 [Rubripirellula amarantea]|uniref:Polysaccharide lyase 14 domain-containing protein n=1 Tax=Rubripirellula amarantea TaxID=2527999 RepID=A0A5C5WKF3_9BACT|nr:hypothetical protein [Rubripirellula amarantea]TWT51268.1 hypothetical protein Pla22_40450 [Rubripirellula amarantea]
MQQITPRHHLVANLAPASSYPNPRSIRDQLPSIARNAIRCTCLAAMLLCMSSSASAQEIFDLNFSKYDEEQSYTRDDLDADWNEPIWEDGIREGWVNIVGPEEAFRGRGKALSIDFPAGSVGPKQGGAQWQMRWDQPATMVRLRYRVKFGEGFDFVRGGKLPGLAGGTAPSGSKPADGYNGWAARMMWRTDLSGTPGDPVQHSAKLMQYVKHPTSGSKLDGKQEDKLYWRDQDDEDIEIVAGKWYRITSLVKLNDVGRANGIILGWLDGKRMLAERGIEFRYTDDLKIDMFYFTTFFGGSTSAWAASKDETIYFDDFNIEIRQ